MFGIGLPEMIVILAVALIVVGPDKLPELARSLAKGINELKKTVDQVKESINEEGNVLGEVHREIKQTSDELRGSLLEETTQQADGEDGEFSEDDTIIDLEPLTERPWEKERKQHADTDTISSTSAGQGPDEQTDKPSQPDTPPPPSSPV